MTWLGLCSSNLQLPLLELGSFVISPENHCCYFCHRASSSIQLAWCVQGCSFPTMFVLLYIDSKELLFRKQRPQFATCLEAATAMQLLNLLLLNAPLGALQLTRAQSSIKGRRRDLLPVLQLIGIPSNWKSPGEWTLT